MKKKMSKKINMKLLKENAWKMSRENSNNAKMKKVEKTEKKEKRKEGIDNDLFWNFLNSEMEINQVPVQADDSLRKSLAFSETNLKSFGQRKIMGEENE